MDKWIVCLKHGTKYNHDYVNKLYNMVCRNSSVPFGFACITEDPSGLNPNIKVIPLPNIPDISGWWYKPWVFSKDLPLQGTILFLDLDLVIIKNIDELWTYSPGKFCIIRDFNRSTIKEWNKFNSSIFKFEKGSYSFVWENFINDTKITKKMHGDQDWIFTQIKNNFQFWPDDWIRSYKWEIRNRQDIIRDGTKRIFKEIVNPDIDPKTKILVFHGDPKPSDVRDPIIVDNWR
jgi:hypothetical protein